MKNFIFLMLILNSFMTAYASDCSYGKIEGSALGVDMPALLKEAGHTFDSGSRNKVEIEEKFKRPVLVKLNLAGTVSEIVIAKIISPDGEVLGKVKHTVVAYCQLGEAVCSPVKERLKIEKKCK